MSATASGNDMMEELGVGHIVNQDQRENRNPLRLKSFVDQYGSIRPQLSAVSRFKNVLRTYWGTLSCLGIVNALLDRIPLIRCLKEYSIRKYLFGDIIAGVTVAIMHIPQGMAYGILTTLPPVYGLYVSFFPVLVYMIFGTCPHLSVGTFAIISLMTAHALEGIPLQSVQMIDGQPVATSNVSDSVIINEKVGIATTLAFFVGLFQLILSFLRLGFLTVYFTEPFVSGFTTGAAVHVFSSQLPSAFGVPSPRNVDVALKLPKFYVKLVTSIVKNINWVSTGISVTSIVALFIAKNLNDRFKSTIRIVVPCELILMIIGTLVSHFAQLETRNGVSVVGPIKSGLPPPRLPPFNQVSSLIVPAITIAAVSLSISISMAKMFSRKHGYKVSSNQELLAYGMTNVVSCFFQCYPSASSLSRSAVQEGSGGKTQLIGGFSCIIVAVILLALTPLFRSLPMACLAAIIIVNLKGLLFQVKDFLFYYRISAMECIVWLITFLFTILFDVDIGLYVGLGALFIINTIRTQKPRFVVLGRVKDTGIYKNIKLFPTAEQYSKIKILRFDESLYACNAPFFKRKFYDLIGIQTQKAPLIPHNKQKTIRREDIAYKYVVLDCSAFNFIDTVGVKMLVEIFNDLKKRGIQLYLCECRYNVRHTLDLMKFYEKTEYRIIFVTLHDAVMAVRTELENESISSVTATVRL